MSDKTRATVVLATTDAGRAYGRDVPPAMLFKFGLIIAYAKRCTEAGVFVAGSRNSGSLPAAFGNVTHASFQIIRACAPAMPAASAHRWSLSACALCPAPSGQSDHSAASPSP